MLARAIARSDGPRGLHPGQGRMEKNLAFLARLSIAGTALVFLVAYFFPHWLSAHIPRAMLIPFLFGSPVLSLSLAARYGDRCGFPVLTPILLLCALVTASNGHFNDLRLLPRIPPSSRGGKSRSPRRSGAGARPIIARARIARRR